MFQNPDLFFQANEAYQHKLPSRLREAMEQNILDTMHVSSLDRLIYFQTKSLDWSRVQFTYNKLDIYIMYDIARWGVLRINR